jgi:putative DNA primase/helicase
LWPLVGTSLAIISDARLSGRSDQAVITERLLSISGEDNLTIDRKNLSPVTVKLSTRVMICTNEMPRLSDSSGALASRFVILRMTKSFYGREDSALTEKLLTELPGILLWAVEGWRRLQERGRFLTPASSAEAVQELDELGSPITAFIRECCTVGPGHSVAKLDLYKAWVSWCAEQGRDNAGTQASFGRDLAAVCPGLTVRQPRVAGARFRLYEGISLGVAYAGEGVV